MQFLRVRIQNAASDRSIPPKLPIFTGQPKWHCDRSILNAKTNSFFVFLTSLLKTKNEKGIRFSFANLKTKNEFVIRFSFANLKTKKEKTVYTRTLHTCNNCTCCSNCQQIIVAVTHGVHRNGKICGGKSGSSQQPCCVV